MAGPRADVNILLAEAEPVTQSLIAGALESWGHRVDIVTHVDTAWAALSHPTAPRLAIVADELADGSTRQLLARLRSHGSTHSTWVLQRLEPGVGHGHADADDVLPMPFDLSLLRSRLHIATRALKLATELAAMQDKLARLSQIDALTGVASRNAVLDALDREMARRARGHGGVSIILADLDGFQRVNATFGSSSGDAALREAATRIATGVRRYDVVGRSGGEEFLVILPGCDATGAALLANRLREAIRGRALITPDGPVALTSSFGIATAADECDSDALLLAATQTLKQAKQAGGDCVCGP